MSENASKNNDTNSRIDGQLDQVLNSLNVMMPNENKENEPNEKQAPELPSSQENISQSTNSNLTSLDSPKTNSASTKHSGNNSSNEMCCGYTEQEIDSHIDLLINRFVAPPKEFRNPILQLLNRRRVASMVAGDYDDAEEQDKALQIYFQVVQAENNKEDEDSRIDQLFHRYQQLKKDYKDISDKWDAKIEDYSNQEQQRYDQLLIKQKEEQDDFHKRWADPEYLRPFNKPSARLLQMREQERAMAVSRMYQQAKIMKQAADKVQREETEEAQARILQSMEREWNRMMQVQETDRQKYTSHKAKYMAFLENEKQKELKSTVNALNQIKSKKDLLSSTKQSSAAITKSAQIIESQSPRTHKKYSTFRSEKKKTKLDVQPIPSTQFTTEKTTSKPVKTKTANSSSLSKTENSTPQNEAQGSPSDTSEEKNQSPSPDESQLQERPSIPKNMLNLEQSIIDSLSTTNQTEASTDEKP